MTAPSYQNITGFFNLMRKTVFIALRRTTLKQINFYLGKQPRDQRRLVLRSIKHLLLLHCRTRTIWKTDIYQTIMNSWAKFQMNEISHLNQNGQLPFCLGPRMPETCLCFWRCSTTLPTFKEMPGNEEEGDIKQFNVNLKASPSPSYTEPQLTGYDVSDEKNRERGVEKERGRERKGKIFTSSGSLEAAGATIPEPPELWRSIRGLPGGNLEQRGCSLSASGGN